MFQPSNATKFGSKVKHYEGAPQDLPFPTDGSPIWIDHPMFAYDKAIRNVPVAMALNHAMEMKMVAFHLKRGGWMREETEEFFDTRAAWLNGEIPIPQDVWERMLEMRADELREEGYPEDHPFGAEFIIREEQEEMEAEEALKERPPPKREQKKAAKQTR